MRHAHETTIDFSLTAGQRAALALAVSAARQPSCAASAASDDSYRPWNQKFEDPATPLVLPI